MTAHPNILVAESHDFAPEAVSLLRRLGNVTLADLDRQALVAAVSDTNVLWVRLRYQIGSDILSAAPNLWAIVTPTTGLNHIDLDAARRYGVHVISLRGEVEFLRDVRATAEHTVALALTLLRHIPAAAAHAAGGGWDRDRFKGRELYGKTAGIVGYGRLGRIVARYLSAFDMRILAADPYVDQAQVEPAVMLVTLDQLLQTADLVTLHVNYSAANHAMFGAAQFALMRQGSWFINTARGELVDETALIDALLSGKLAGAAVDVLCDEGALDMTSHPLGRYARAHDNLIVTPHIGGCTVESLAKTEVFLARKLQSLLDGGYLGIDAGNGRF